MRPATALKAFVTILFWGASFIATKVALREVTPVTVIAVRFGMGVLVMLALLGWRRQFRLAARPDLLQLALLGLAGVTFHQLLQSFGLLTTTATNSGLIVALTPVFTAMLAWGLLGERLTVSQALGLAIASFGAVVIVGRGFDLAMVLERAAPGDALLLISAANWALFTTLSKRMLGKYPPVVMMAHVMAFGWLAFLPLLAIEGGWRALPAVSASGWWSLLFLGVGCSGVAYALWYDALAETRATSLASFLYIQPVVTVVAATVILSEPVSAAVAGGGGAILAGVWLVNSGREGAGVEQRGRPGAQA
jgi:drug/metabolite transporter (DMT)-like permease